MKHTLIALALLSFSGAASATFCAIDNNGNKSCRFATLSSCRAYIGAKGGCALEETARVSPKTYDYSVPDMNAAYAQGQKTRLDRQESEARTALLKAQAEEVRNRAAQPKNTCPAVGYKCAANDGTTFYSSTPFVGCTVVAVQQ